MPAAFGEESSTFFGVSSAAIDAAREALTEGGSLAEVLVMSAEDGNLAPLIPIATRLGVFRDDLESVVSSAARSGLSQETVDALLAVALTVSERFPEAG